jgi:phasin family protein
MAAPRPDEKPGDVRQQKPSGQSAQQSAQESGRVISDATSRIARSAAEVSERASQIGLEVVKQNNETAHHVWEASTDMATRLAERSANQFGRVFGLSGEEAGEAVESASSHLGAIAQSATVIASAYQEIAREWFEMARRIMQGTVDRSESLAHCRTPQDLFAVQTELARENAKIFLHGTKRLSELSARAAQEATSKISEGPRQAAA